VRHLTNAIYTDRYLRLPLAYRRRKVNALREARSCFIHAGVVLLALSVTWACVYAQSPRTSADPVQATTACDAELAAQVKAALRAAPAVNDTHIDVNCENGKLVLTGLVEDERALLDAIRVATKAAKGHPIVDAVSIIKTSSH
jgi:hypothetical protein